MVVVQHAGTGGAVSGASSGCPLSNEELTVTCLAPLPLELQLHQVPAIFRRLTKGGRLKERKTEKYDARVNQPSWRERTKCNETKLMMGQRVYKA